MPLLRAGERLPTYYSGLRRAPLHAAAVSLFARMSTQPTAVRKRQNSTLIRSLETSGVWPLLDMLQIRAAHDDQAALLNWKADAYNGSVVNSPTFTADRGFLTNGTSSYVDSGFNPSTAVAANYTQDSASLGYWSLTAAQAGAGFGWFDGTDGATVNMRNTSNLLNGRINNATAITSANTNGLGLAAGNRSASNAIQTYRNGVQAQTGTNVSTALNNQNLLDGRGAAASYGAITAAAVFAGGSMTAAQHLALYNALLAYLTDVGAV